jgi:AcrR family transcriptional regulator
VLAAARAAFAERGFDGATIRGIATAAGVDPALVHHYFGSKDKLFIAAVEAPVDPGDFLRDVLASPADELGANVVRLLLRLWDGPARPAGLALVRSAVGNEWSAKLLREFLVSQVLRRVMGTLDLPQAEREARGALVGSQLMGLVMARYVLKVEPLASASPASLVEAVGPTVQRYLTGDVVLPAPPEPVVLTHRGPVRRLTPSLRGVRGTGCFY